LRCDLLRRTEEPLSPSASLLGAVGFGLAAIGAAATITISARCLQSLLLDRRNIECPPRETES